MGRTGGGARRRGHRARRRLGHAIATVVAIAAVPVDASPNVPLDDPVYDQLDQLELAGAHPRSRGGLAPLTEARVQEVLGGPPTLPGGWWFLPITRAALHVAVVHETDRGVGTAARPRSIAAAIALSCEYQEGRPCGNGQGLDTELDAAAGYGAWLSGSVRLRLRTGRDAYATGFDLDRAYVNAELGPIAAEVGRDVLVLGPAVRTEPGWGRNAPPLDHLRLSGARPFVLAPWLRMNAIYVLGRLGDPQTYPGNLVSIARAQLELADRVELGATQLLQLGGQGAAGFGLVDFLREHVTRRDASASATDSSNRRIGFDLAVHIAGLGGARVVYQVMFEDLRKQLASALRHDTDHVVGLATRWLTLEWRKTGARSYEHMPRVTGFTSYGEIVGDPLGPAAQAVFAGGRIPMPWGGVRPWAEIAWLGSDTYSFGPGPIVRTGSGETEIRVRIGVRLRLSLGEHLELDPEAMLEDVEREAFVPEARRINAVLRAALVWRPAAPRSNVDVLQERRSVAR